MMMIDILNSQYNKRKLWCICRIFQRNKLKHIIMVFFISVTMVTNFKYEEEDV